MCCSRHNFYSLPSFFSAGEARLYTPPLYAMLGVPHGRHDLTGVDDVDIQALHAHPPAGLPLKLLLVGEESSGQGTQFALHGARVKEISKICRCWVLINEFNGGNACVVADAGGGKTRL